jgi:hypothetical protein
MAAKKSVSRTGSNIMSAVQATGVMSGVGVIPSVLRELIEAERSRLMDADAVLHCAVLALGANDTGGRDTPDYQSVINTARALIAQSVQRLDAATIHTLLRSPEMPARAVAISAPPVAEGGEQDAVREDRTKYLN